MMSLRRIWFWTAMVIYCLHVFHDLDGQYSLKSFFTQARPNALAEFVEQVHTRLVAKLNDNTVVIYSSLASRPPATPSDFSMPRTLCSQCPLLLPTIITGGNEQLIILTRLQSTHMGVSRPRCTHMCRFTFTIGVLNGV